jgi:hypothetical protein
MNDIVNWPAGEFTLQTAVAQNPHLAEAVVRKKLSEAIAAKRVVQTKKGNAKTKGSFQVVAATG